MTRTGPPPRKIQQRTKTDRAGRQAFPPTAPNERDRMTTIADALRPADLGERGQALWDALAVKVEPAAAVLLAEACRIADRLERLDRIIAGRGDEWLRLKLPDGEGKDLVVIVDGALVEARQQTQVLRQTLAHLAVGSIATTPTGGDGRSIVDELLARRAARLPNPEAG